MYNDRAKIINIRIKQKFKFKVHFWAYKGYRYGDLSSKCRHIHNTIKWIDSFLEKFDLSMCIADINAIHEVSDRLAIKTFNNSAKSLATVFNVDHTNVEKKKNTYYSKIEKLNDFLDGLDLCVYVVDNGKMYKLK